jgi:hypothetical protein
MLRVSLLAAVLALALPSLANARSPREVMHDFGLLGTWAADCKQPSGASNAYAVYAGLPDGKVRRTYYNTPERKEAYQEYVITRAIRLPADMISYVLEDPAKHDRVDVILLKDGDKFKIWSSVRDDGTVLVEGGKFASGSDESPWQTRCHD